MDNLEVLNSELERLNTEINKWINSYNLINKKVSNKMYGIGKIANVNGEIIDVEFESGHNAKFQFPIAFLKGFLKFENEKDFEALNKISELKSEKTHIEEKIQEIKKELQNLEVAKQEETYIGNEITMLAVLTNISFDDCVHYNIYCCKARNNFSKNIEYLALYRNKCINAIGKVKKIVKANYIDNKWRTSLYYGKEAVNDEDIKQIEALRTRSLEMFKCDIGEMEHYYFIIEEFVLANFEKTTNFPLQKTKYFNLCKILQKDEMPEIRELVSLINQKEW